MKSYALRDFPDASTRALLAQYDDFTQELLASRGASDQTSAAAFLSPSYDEHTHDPFLLPDMEKAVLRIARAVEKGEKICIYSDYDCDGIPGGALLFDAFRKGGYGNVVSYVPHRGREGYGVNAAALTGLAEQGVSLVITVDCGIVDSDAIAQGNACGLDSIVTDHHLPAQDSEGNDLLPPAYAVIDHKRSDNQYPFPELCGAATAFKLAHALALRGVIALSPGQEKWLLDLAGLATVADLVPLVGENRVLAHYGLSVLRKTRRPGIRELIRVMRVEHRHLSEDDIAFSIAPRINAASRMGNPDDALSLLLTEEDAEAATLAAHLDRINTQRKSAVARIAKDIKARLLRSDVREVIVLGNPEWKPSLLGLAATSVAEEYRRPVFLWGREAESSSPDLKGSCRSDGVTDLVALMRTAQDAFIQFGGHKLSGGFSVRFDAIHALEDRLVDAFTNIERKEISDTVFVDRELPLVRLREYWGVVKQFAPFGMGNPKPLFLVKDARLKKVSWFGKSGEHLRLSLADEGGTAEAILFFAKGAALSKNPEELQEGQSVSCVGTLEESRFLGKTELRIRISDIV